MTKTNRWQVQSKEPRHTKITHIRDGPLEGAILAMAVIQSASIVAHGKEHHAHSVHIWRSVTCRSQCIFGCKVVETGLNNGWQLWFILTMWKERLHSNIRALTVRWNYMRFVTMLNACLFFSARTKQWTFCYYWPVKYLNKIILIINR